MLTLLEQFMEEEFGPDAPDRLKSAIAEAKAEVQSLLRMRSRLEEQRASVVAGLNSWGDVAVALLVLGGKSSASARREVEAWQPSVELQ